MRLFAMLSVFVAMGASDALAAPSKERIAAKIEKLVADKRCQTDSDCDSAPMGYRSCGGPDRYVIFSKRKTRRDALNRAIKEFNAVDKRSKAETMGICAVEMQPAIACTAGTCAER